MVRFYNEVSDALLQFAVIVARHQNQYVFCKHRQRETLEIPGGHREPGEQIDETARRELQEETGALVFTLEPVCVYSVAAEQTETFGKLYFADIQSFEPELHSEIEKIVLMDTLPTNWTYPQIQPALIAEAKKRGLL